VVLLANKVDALDMVTELADFHRLGFGPPLPISALHRRGGDALKNHIIEHLAPLADETTPADPIMKIAIVGRRNVGKSTFINALVNSPRMIVSEVPGTTRDSVDVRFELDGKPFVAIDTPGIRKRKSVRRDIEFYGLHRAQRSIRRADVVLMFFDARETISTVDRQLVHYIEENHKPCVFVVNKWDLLADKHATGEWADYVGETFPTMAYVPIAFITAQTGKNVKKLINHAQMLFKQSLVRLGTGELNRLIQRALELHPPPMNRTRRPKIYYATQTAVQPPTIVLMCNDPKAFSASYRRYLLAALRDNVEFAEVPIRLFFDKKQTEPRRTKKDA
jgi:GTP-binding protein